MARKYVKRKVILPSKCCFLYSLGLFKNKKNHILALRMEYKRILDSFTWLIYHQSFLFPKSYNTWNTSISSFMSYSWSKNQINYELFLTPIYNFIKQVNVAKKTSTTLALISYHFQVKLMMKVYKHCGICIYYLFLDIAL